MSKKVKKWEVFKKKLIQLFGGLLMEDRGDGLYVISLGRVAFWAVFIPALIIWYSAIKDTNGIGILQANQTLKDLPPGLGQFLMAITGYNLTKHISSTISDVWGGAKTTVVNNNTNVVENAPDTSDTDNDGHGDT